MRHGRRRVRIAHLFLGGDMTILKMVRGAHPTWMLLLVLTGCASPCRLTLNYPGDLHKPIALYSFQPGVACIY